MTALEILERLLDNLRSVPRCDDHAQCAQCDALDEAVDAAENELDRARLITRDITEAA